MTHWSDKLVERDACREAVRFALTHQSFDDAWHACDRGDWMLWIAGRLSGAPDSADRRKLVGAAAECAELVLPSFEKRYPDDMRVRDCIAACKAYSRGEIDMAQLHKARTAYAAYAADYDEESKMRKKCADVVRKHYLQAPVL